jgi:hypothetical protein
MQGFSDVLFGLTLRPYQEDLMAVFEKRRSEGDRIFHFLAPPGSGKTIMGLEMVRRLGRTAVILSPNSAVQGQWVRKLQSLTDEISISTDPRDDADVLSLTYQSISVKDRHSGELHANALEILKVLAERETLILDECHHLTSHWAEVIQALITPGKYVVGLTATPPLHREAAAQNRYLSLLQHIDYEIQTPAIIREGYLAPFQDLVLITEAEDDEVLALRASSGGYAGLIKRMENPEVEIPSLQQWTYSRLEEFTDATGTPVPFDELFYSEPDLCIALARYTKSRWNDLPLSVMLCDEMEISPTFADMLLVLWDYARGVLAGSAPLAFAQMRTAMLELGYRYTPYGFRAQKGTAQRLGLSGSKIRGTLQILAREIELMGDDVRCLILADFEGSRETTGVSARTVLSGLTQDETADELDPILMTGRSVLVDDDLLPRFRDAAAAFFSDAELHVSIEEESVQGFYEIRGIGPDWNTRNYVHLITRLLETGVTKCLVGTRALLGEGWDSIKLSTLIDLTQVTTYVSVNQIRGRSLRHDPDNPLKAVNNWDVVTIADDPQRGFVDLDRFIEKHTQFYGLSEDNVIEKGVGHVHPAFTNRSQSQIWYEREGINSFMLRRCAERSDLRTRWDVGKPYRNHETVSLDFVPSEGARQQLSAKRGRELQACTVHIRGDQRRMSYFAVLAFVPILLVTMATKPFGIHPILSAVCVVAPLFCATLGLTVGKRIKKYRSAAGSPEDAEENITAMGRAVLLSLHELSLLSNDIDPSHISLRRREGQSIRIFLEGDAENVFAASVGEVFAPIQSQRYIVERQELVEPANLTQWFSKSRTYRHVAWYPVPSILGGKRKSADIFHRHWQQEVSPGRIFYTKRGEGLKLLKQAFRKKAFPMSQHKKHIWL